MALPQLYTEAQAAAYLGKSIITLRRWRKAGLIGYFKLGRDVQYSEAHLLAFLERGTKAPVEKTIVARHRAQPRSSKPGLVALLKAQEVLRTTTDRE